MNLVRAFLPAGSYNRRDRRIAVGLWAIGVGQGYTQSLPTATLPFVRSSLQLSEGEMSLLLGLVRLGSLFAVVFSTWGDRAGRRRPLLAAVLTLGVAGFAAGFSGTPFAFGTAEAVVRAATAAVGVLATVVITEQLSAGVRAYGVSIYAAAVSLGSGLTLVTLPVAGLSANAWRWLFWASVVAPLPVFMLRSVQPHLTRRPTRGWWRHLSGELRRRFTLLAASAAATASFASLAAAFTIERLVNDLHFSATGASVIALIGGTLGGAGFFLGGSQADRWGRKPVATGGLALAVFGGLMFYWADHIPLIVTSSTLAALGSFAALPALGVWRAESFPAELRARAAAWINNAAIVGASGGLLTGGVLVDRIGLTATVTALAGIGTIGLLLLLALPETRPGPADRLVESR